MSSQPLLWVELGVNAGFLPALIDTGAQFSCIRGDVVSKLRGKGKSCRLIPCDVMCLMADGQTSHIDRAVVVRVRLLSFSWRHDFKILDGGPFPAILGLDFLRKTQMRLDLSNAKFCFAFKPEREGQLSLGEGEEFRRETAALREDTDVQVAVMGQVPAGGLEISNLCSEFPDLFSPVLGTANCEAYVIELCDVTPVRSPPYRCAPPKQAILRRMVNELIEQGVVKPSKSPYASPAFLVPKSRGEYRLVVDYRKVNAKIKFDCYPLPTIEQAFEQFAGAQVFSVLDLKSAYFQIPLSAKSRRITAFCTPFGLYEFCKLPMGISVGSQGLSRVVDELFGDLKGKFVFNFLDDLVVYSKSLAEHTSHVHIVLDKLREAGFTLNPDKITLAAKEIQYLGHLISAKGIRVLPDRIDTIREFPCPVNLRSVRRFLGMVGFYARFIPDYSRCAEPLHALKRKGAKFVWGPAQQSAFEQLKQALCQAPVLQMPDFTKDFVLSTDASDVAVSAVLQQRVEGHLAPIAFYSRLLSPVERRYSTYEKECLAILMGCEKCRSYLEHKEFEIECDNLSLCWLLKRAKDVGRLGRWVLRLAPFKFRVRHTRGVDNIVADALSRMFDGHTEDLPDLVCASLLEALPLVYSSLVEHQATDLFCQITRDNVLRKDPSAIKFDLHNDRLCYFPKGARRRRWVVPVLLRGMVLAYFHDAMISGHLGAHKTFRKASANFWWPKMREDVFAYVRKCVGCQQAKPAQNTAVGMHSASPVSRPLERVFIDFVGPLPRTRSGNVAILVVVDGFSKFVALFPVRKMTAASAVNCLSKSYFPVFGTPERVVSDNARVFRCKAFRDLCFQWGVQHITTTPYYPQGSLAERVNRNLKSALKIYHSRSQNRWDEGLPWLATAFNTAFHESTQVTPDMLFLGREIKGPLETKWDLSTLTVDCDKKARGEFWHKAFDCLKQARDRVAQKYNRQRREHRFKAGDTVMFRRNLISSKPLNVTAKLMPRWSDPVVIAKFVRPNVVLLGNPDTGVIVRRAHVSQLKPHFS